MMKVLIMLTYFEQKFQMKNEIKYNLKRVDERDFSQQELKERNKVQLSEVTMKGKVLLKDLRFEHC